jgi:hypothetical protein
MGTLDVLGTSVSNQLMPRNKPQDGRIQINRGGSLRKGIFLLIRINEDQIVTGYIGKSVNVKYAIMCVTVLPEPAVKMERHLSFLLCLPLELSGCIMQEHPCISGSFRQDGAVVE